MKSKIAIFCAAWLCCAMAVAQTAGAQAAPRASVAAQTGAAKSAPGAAAQTANAGDLQSVLNDMDRAAATFRSAQADFNWDQFTRVVNEHDLQKGVIYYRRQGKEVQMAADISSPAVKQVLFTGGKVDVCQPSLQQATEYNAGKNKAAVESFLVLGFGGRGHDLPKSFDVTFAGWENVDGIKAAKLHLVPNAPNVRNMFSQILLWIDPARGISVQQQLIEPSGDYRLAKYANIKLNQNISGNLFKMNSACKNVIRPQG